jgi:hypothetical protein
VRVGDLVAAAKRRRVKMKGKLTVADETENDDGTWTLMFDADDEFVVWFKEWQGLKRWSQKRFQKVILKAITEAAIAGEVEGDCALPISKERK